MITLYGPVSLYSSFDFCDLIKPADSQHGHQALYSVNKKGNDNCPFFTEVCASRLNQYTFFPFHLRDRRMCMRIILLLASRGGAEENKHPWN